MQNVAQLVRVKQLLELLQISNSTLYSWLKEDGRYHKPLFPRPTYFEGSRTPFWRLSDIQDFITASSIAPEQKSAQVTSSVAGADVLDAPTESSAQRELMSNGGIPIVVRKRHRAIGDGQLITHRRA